MYKLCNLYLFSLKVSYKQRILNYHSFRFTCNLSLVMIIFFLSIKWSSLGLWYFECLRYSVRAFKVFALSLHKLTHLKSGFVNLKEWIKNNLSKMKKYAIHHLKGSWRWMNEWMNEWSLFPLKLHNFY